MTLHPTLASILAGVLCAGASAQQVYRCTTPGGQPAFQQAPCSEPGGGRRVVVTPANVIEGRPAGDAVTRQQAERSARIRTAIESRTVLLGMTEAEMQQAWGTPNNVNTDMYESGVAKQWVFLRGGDGTQYVYTTNGLVTAVQSRPMQVTAADRGPCYSRQDIENARTAATSILLTPSQAEEARARIKRMRPC